MKDEDMIVPSHNQVFCPRIGVTVESEGWGLNHIDLMLSLLFVGDDCFSLVTYASICNCKLEKFEGVSEIGRRRSSKVRSDEFLNELMRRILGVLHFSVSLKKTSSRKMEMNGVIPLPPLTITSASCLQELT